ncbi:plasmid transfer protein TraA [Embleya sp. NPDC056538]|uniref:plasmid transfer protein TraA n=1 Tax=Embleya sp. NPDC056538 TaxID=3345858 RepID=UPI0036C735DA
MRTLPRARRDCRDEDRRGCACRAHRDGRAVLTGSSHSRTRDRRSGCGGSGVSPARIHSPRSRGRGPMAQQRRRSTAQDVLGDPEFVTNKSIRDYCNGGRLFCRDGSLELAMAAEELYAVLSQIAPVDALLAGRAGRKRAKDTSKHLIIAAEALKYAAGSMAKAYASFQKNYAAELQAAGVKSKPVKPAFKFEA